jgi:diguanylate cyclase (GGDEF)-like protein
MEHKIYRKLKQNIKEVRSKIGPQCHKKIKPLLESIDQNLMALYRLVIKDAKTGLYNSRFFDALLEIEIERAKRGQMLSLMALDLDNLKEVNDLHGHKTGDDVLKRIASLLRENIRKSDIASRFGGDEFVVLLPFASCKKAVAISNRIREKVMRDRILKKYNVTLSIGVADFEKGDTANKLFNKADFALLCAKKQGKNLTMSYKDI